MLIISTIGCRHRDCQVCPDPDPIPVGYQRVGEIFTCTEGFVGSPSWNRDGTPDITPIYGRNGLIYMISRCMKVQPSIYSIDGMLHVWNMIWWYRPYRLYRDDWGEQAMPLALKAPMALRIGGTGDHAMPCGAQVASCVMMRLFGASQVPHRVSPCKVRRNRVSMSWLWVARNPIFCRPDDFELRKLRYLLENAFTAFTFVTRQILVRCYAATISGCTNATEIAISLAQLIEVDGSLSLPTMGIQWVDHGKPTENMKSSMWHFSSSLGCLMAIDLLFKDSSWVHELMIRDMAWYVFVAQAPSQRDFSPCQAGEAMICRYMKHSHKL